ncbi:hypothetical protein TFLX_02977 [Thermoflexales bacterium]|nr:hypothetical protein TFLX_02977 [Thermoflexales bacterium]
MTQLPSELHQALQHQRLLIVWGDMPFELPPRVIGERAVVINRLLDEAAKLPAPRLRLSVMPPLPILSLDPTDRVEREFGGRSLTVLLTRQDVLVARIHNLIKLAGDLNSRMGLVLSREEVQRLPEDEDKRYLLDQVRSLVLHDGAVLLVGCEPTSETFKAWWRVIRPTFGTASIFAAGEFSTAWPDEVTYLGTVLDVISAILTSAQALTPKMETATSFDVSSGEQESAPGTTRTGGVVAKSDQDLAPIEVQTLRVDAAVPEQVFVKRVFDLAVAVRQLTSPLLTVEDLKHVESGEVQATWERGLPLINLRVEVDAPDCEIVGKRSIPFRLVRGTDAPPIYFHLKPLRAGEMSIVVTVYQEDYWLGSARVNTSAAEQAAQPAGKVQLTVASQPLWLDCELRILDSIAHTYRVELTLNGEQHFSGALSAELAAWSVTGDPAADGQALFNLLLADGELLKAWGEARGRSKRRRLRLRIDPPELHAWPWELLRDGAELIAADADTPFSRYLAVGKEWGRAVADRPMRVLAVISNPIDLGAKYDLPAADVELEEQTLREALLPHTQTPSLVPGEGLGVRLTFLSPPITLDRLEAELRSGYHVLHFIGHGGFNARQQQAALYFENPDRTAHRVIDVDFAGMLDRLQLPPQLVVLAACQSATQSLHEVFTGLGPQLVQIGLPAVVAMQADVTLLTARQFAARFYRQLLTHGTVDLAMNEARSTLMTHGRFDAAVPVLFMRLRDGRLWSEVPRVPAAPIEPLHSVGREPLSKEDRASLERQLRDARENLRLIEERKAEYVLGVEVPLQIIKEERRLRDKIADLETQLR